MNTLVPLEYYAPLFYNLVLLIILFNLMRSTVVAIQDEGNLNTKDVIGKILVLFLTLYIGLRPVSGKYFIDMGVYSRAFREYASGASLMLDKDPAFEYFTMYCSRIMSEEMFFLVCACLYIIPIYLACKKIFKEYWFYGFLISLACFTFWSNGTNGIRNGIASSICFLGMAYHDRKIVMWLLFAWAYSFHKSMLMVIGAFFLAHYITNPKILIYCWIASIPISYVAGDFFENTFTGLGLVNDDRLSLYFSDEENSEMATYVPSFRWDFILYSSLAVVAGYYYTIKRNYKDTFYSLLLSSFLISNTFWILIVRVKFSNRFAALSWFFMGFVMIYPLLKHHLVKRQHQWVVGITAIFYLFAYVLLFLLAKK